MELSNVSGLILAGGASRRMGQPKAALPLGGRTLLAHQTEKLRSLGIRDILLSGEILAPPEGTTVLPDRLPDRGPLGGLYTGLSAARTCACLVLSVDVPLLPASELRALLEAHRSGATLLSHNGTLEPLIGVYDCALAANILPLIAREGAPVRRLLEQIAVRLVEARCAEADLRNCNTPEDYRAVLQRFSETMPQRHAAEGTEESACIRF